MRNNYAYFRFYGSLNDFLPSNRKRQEFMYQVKGNPAIKDTIEALGVPHPEVELILVNGQSVDFDYSLQDGDRFSVYPHFTSLQLGSRARAKNFGGDGVHNAIRSPNVRSFRIRYLPIKDSTAWH